MNLTYKNVKFITISAKNSKKLDRLIFSCIINTRGLFRDQTVTFTHTGKKKENIEYGKNTSNVVHNIEEVFRCPADV